MNLLDDEGFRSMKGTMLLLLSEANINNSII